MFDVNGKKNIIVIFGENDEDVLVAAEAFVRINRRFLEAAPPYGEEIRLIESEFHVYNWLSEAGATEADARRVVLESLPRSQTENPDSIPVLILSKGVASLSRQEFKVPVRGLLFLTTHAIGVERTETQLAFTVVRSRTSESFRTGVITDHDVIWDNTK